PAGGRRRSSPGRGREPDGGGGRGPARGRRAHQGRRAPGPHGRGRGGQGRAPGRAGRHRPGRGGATGPGGRSGAGRGGARRPAGPGLSGRAGRDTGTGVPEERQVFGRNAETRRRTPPGPSAGPDGRQREAGEWGRRTAKRLPTPSRLSHHRRPPISSASRRPVWRLTPAPPRTGEPSS